MIGPITTQESNFPVRAMYYPNCHLVFVRWCFFFFPRAVNCLFSCVCVVVGIWTVLEWEWRLGMLDKPGVFGSLINRARGLDFFSTTPE